MSLVDSANTYLIRPDEGAVEALFCCRGEGSGARQRSPVAPSPTRDDGPCDQPTGPGPSALPVTENTGVTRCTFGVGPDLRTGRPRSRTGRLGRLDLQPHTGTTIPPVRPSSRKDRPNPPSHSHTFTPWVPRTETLICTVGVDPTSLGLTRGCMRPGKSSGTRPLCVRRSNPKHS